jgi:hypothetical protein
MWCAKGKTHSVNGDPSVSDKHCASVFGHAACVGFAQQQKVRPGRGLFHRSASCSLIWLLFYTFERLLLKYIETHTSWHPYI